MLSSIIHNARSLKAALFMSFSASFLLFGYEFIRSPSNTLFKQAYGADSLPYVMASLPFAVICSLWIYGKLISLLGPRKTLFTTSIGSGLLIFFCWWLTTMGFKPATYLLYIVREVYCVLLIEQYWSFLNSTLGTKEAKVLNGPIIGLTSLGGALAAWIVGFSAESIGTVNLLLFAAATVLPAAILSDLAYVFCGEPEPVHKKKKRSSLELSLFKTQRLLPLLFCLIVVSQVVSTVQGLNFQSALSLEFPNADEQTAYSGDFFALLLLVSAVFQFVISPIFLRFTSVHNALLLAPLIQLGISGFSIVNPGLAAAGAGYFCFKVFDYSLFRAAKETLYIPLSFAARYRAKEIIDLFGYRTGKGGTSFILILLRSGGIGLAGLYGWIAVIASSIWLWVTFEIVRQPETKLVKKVPALNTAPAS